MKFARRGLSRAGALKRLLLDESGQAMTEYVGVSTLLLFGSMAAGAAYPFSKLVFQALQGYVNFYFYCLNIAVG